MQHPTPVPSFGPRTWTSGAAVLCALALLPARLAADELAAPPGTASGQAASPHHPHLPVPSHTGAAVEPAPGDAPVDATAEYPVPAPPLTEGIFPCSECHADMELNRERRALEDEHTEIVLNHGPRERWCFDCHNPEDRDQLRLASGALVPFTESYRLCGQCHGPKLRDWRVGVHGKRVGQWDGKKRYLLCAHCHNPHSPRFKPLAPMPPPQRPKDIR